MSCLSAWLWGAEGGRGAVYTGLPQTAGLSGGQWAQDREGPHCLSPKLS